MLLETDAMRPAQSEPILGDSPHGKKSDQSLYTIALLKNIPVLRTTVIAVMLGIPGAGLLYHSAAEAPNTGSTTKESIPQRTEPGELHDIWSFRNQLPELTASDEESEQAQPSEDHPFSNDTAQITKCDDVDWHDLFINFKFGLEIHPAGSGAFSYIRPFYLTEECIEYQSALEDSREPDVIEHPISTEGSSETTHIPPFYSLQSAHDPEPSSSPTESGTQQPDDPITRPELYPNSPSDSHHERERFRLYDLFKDPRSEKIYRRHESYSLLPSDSLYLLSLFGGESRGSQLNTHPDAVAILNQSNVITNPDEVMEARINAI